jgi:hypothetical protein
MKRIFAIAVLLASLASVALADGPGLPPPPKKAKVVLADGGMLPPPPTKPIKANEGGLAA